MYLYAFIIINNVCGLSRQKVIYSEVQNIFQTNTVSKPLINPTHNNCY